MCYEGWMRVGELILVNLPEPFSLALHSRPNILAVRAARKALLIIGNDYWLSPLATVYPGPLISCRAECSFMLLIRILFRKALLGGGPFHLLHGKGRGGGIHFRVQGNSNKGEETRGLSDQKRGL